MLINLHDIDWIQNLMNSFVDFLKRMVGHSGQVRSLAFEPESTEIFASGGEDGMLRLWSICDGRCLKVPIFIHFFDSFVMRVFKTLYVRKQ